MIFPDNKSWTHFLSIEMAYLLVFSLPFSTEPFHNDTFRLYLFTLHFFYRLAGDQYCTIGYLDFIFKYPNTVRFLSIENYLSDLSLVVLTCNKGSGFVLQSNPQLFWKLSATICFKKAHHLSGFFSNIY